MSRVRMKGLALPTEHGGWGFLLEPIVMGLLAAPSLGGVFLSLSAVSVFLLRQPFRVLVTANEKLAASPRRRWALGLTAAYGAVAVASLAAGLSIAGSAPLGAFVCCAPLVLAFILYDTQKRSRRLLAELAGPLGLAGSAPALFLAGGRTAEDAVVVWFLMAARVVPSVLYVRARLRSLRGGRADRAGVVTCHAGFLAVAVLLGAAKAAPYTASVGLCVLLVRAVWGLSGRAKPVRATQVGILEIVYGIVYVLIAAAGYWGSLRPASGG